MTLPLMVSLPDSSFYSRLTSIENLIARNFARRVRHFHISVRDDALVLEGCTRSYYFKQEVQQAVICAIDLPIAANNIVVGARELTDRNSQFDDECCPLS